MTLILLLLAVLLGGGGGLTALLGGQSSQTPSASQQQTQGGSINWAEMLGGLNSGSVSSGWQSFYPMPDMHAVVTTWSARRLYRHSICSTVV